MDPDHRTIVERESHSYPIKQKADLLSATQGVEKHWRELCEHLSIDEELFKKLDHSSGANSQKMEQCLTDYFDNHGPDWTAVVTIIADYPISNLRLACKIAKKYMNMDNKECESTFRHSRDEL